MKVNEVLLSSMEQNDQDFYYFYSSTSYIQIIISLPVAENHKLFTNLIKTYINYIIIMLEVSSESEKQAYIDEEQSGQDIFSNQINHIEVIHSSQIPIQPNAHGFVNVTYHNQTYQMNFQEKNYQRGNNYYPYYKQREHKKKIQYREKYPSHHTDQQTQRIGQPKESIEEHQILDNQHGYKQVKPAKSQEDIVKNNMYQTQVQVVRKSIQSKHEALQKVNAQQKYQNQSRKPQLDQNKLIKLRMIETYDQKQQIYTKINNANDKNALNNLIDQIKQIQIELKVTKQNKTKQKQRSKKKQTIIISTNIDKQQQENSFSDFTRFFSSFKLDNSLYVYKQHSNNVLQYQNIQRDSFADVEVNIRFKGPILVLKIKSFNLCIQNNNFQVKLQKTGKQYKCQQKYSNFLQILQNKYQGRRQYALSFVEANYSLCRVKLPPQSSNIVKFDKQNLHLSPLTINLFSITCICSNKFSASPSSGFTCPKCSLPSTVEIIMVTVTIK